MARAPTLAQWELDLLRSIENVVRLGHLRGVEPGALELDQGRVSLAPDALVVHCAAARAERCGGDADLVARRPSPVQPIRSGFPCFGAALSGYVEATRRGTDEEKNELCPGHAVPGTRWPTGRG